MIFSDLGAESDLPSEESPLDMLGSDLTGKEPFQIQALFIHEFVLKRVSCGPIVSVKLPGNHQEVLGVIDLLINMRSAFQILKILPPREKRNETKQPVCLLQLRTPLFFNQFLITLLLGPTKALAKLKRFVA